MKNSWTALLALAPLGGLCASLLMPVHTVVRQDSPTQEVASPGVEESRLLLADGLRAEAFVLVAKPLFDQESTDTVVPVSVNIEVLFSGVAVFQLHLLKLPLRTSSELIGTTAYGISAASAEPALAGVLPSRNYLLQVRPKGTRTWGDVRNEADVVLIATPL